MTTKEQMNFLTQQMTLMIIDLAPPEATEKEIAMAVMGIAGAFLQIARFPENEALSLMSSLYETHGGYEHGLH